MSGSATLVAQLANVESFVQKRDYAAALSALDQIEHSVVALTEAESRLAELLRAECLAFLGRYAEAEEMGRRLAAEYRLGSEHELYGRACFVLAVTYYFMGDIDPAIESANLAIFTFRRIDSHDRAARATNWLGNIVFDRGDYEHVLRSYRDCEAYARKHGLTRWVSVARDNRSVVHVLKGDPWAAVEAIRGTRRVLVQLNEETNVARHDLRTAYLSVQMRRHRRARTILDAASKQTRNGWPLREQGIWHEYYGELELDQRNFGSAHEHLNAAIAIGEQSGPDQSLIGQSRRLRAQVLLAEGNPAEALAECDRALVAIGVVGERIEEGIVRRVQAQVHAVAKHPAEARVAYGDSIAKLRVIGANLELGRTLLAAGQCDAYNDRERLAHLLEADRLFAGTGIGYWIETSHEALTQTRREARLCPVGEAGDDPSAEFITTNPEMQKMLEMARAWASSDIAVLITGETGTGKDLVAKLIHQMSPRRDGPFVDLDLNVLPDSLWESELFGHTKGTFTGASSEKLGLLQSANGGTVFLNEIGNLPLELQAKLLEFLDSHEIRRLGTTERVRLDVRLIAATNRDLTEAVELRQFRADLLYRLNDAHVHLTPLRERTEDVPMLLRHFLALRGANGMNPSQFASQPWVQRAREYPWTGNVRQLISFVHRLSILGGVDDTLEWDRWSNELFDHLERVDEHNRKEDAKKRLKLIRSLERHEWNQRAVAREMGMTEGGVRHLMRRWDVDRPQE